MSQEEGGENDRLLLLPLLEPSGDNGIPVSDGRSEVKRMHYISHIR
jgi:hypothetical protein